MLILLDVFAELLGIRPEELLQVAHTGGGLEGLQLPSHQHLLRAAMMFDYAEATEFAHKWHERAIPPPPATSSEPLVLLGVFAEQAGIAPLALYQAVTAGKKLRRLRPPAPVSTGAQLLFEPTSVSRFVQAYRGALKKT